jgi:hypothetical protein
MTNDHVAVGSVVADRNLPAPTVVAIAFMPMTPVLVTIGAHTGWPNAGMSSS